MSEAELQTPEGEALAFNELQSCIAEVTGVPADGDAMARLNEVRDGDAVSYSKLSGVYVRWVRDLAAEAKVVPAAEHWLAQQTGLPANTTGIFSEKEFELFLTLFAKLSEAGKKKVKYADLCKEWNKEVVGRLRSIPAQGDPAEVIAEVRPKTKTNLENYAKTVASRFNGMASLKPFLETYKDMRRKLKVSNKKATEAFTSAPKAAAVAKVTVEATVVAQRAAVPPPIQLTGHTEPVTYVTGVSTAGAVLPTTTESPTDVHVGTGGQSTGGGSKRAGRNKETCSKCWKKGGGAWVLKWVHHPVTGEQTFRNGHGDKHTTRGRFVQHECPNNDVVVLEDEHTEYTRARQRRQGKIAITKLFNEAMEDLRGTSGDMPPDI